jgi:hypothetical protein
MRLSAGAKLAPAGASILFGGKFISFYAKEADSFVFLAS